MAIAPLPRASARAWIRSARRASSATRWPSAARARAVASPMPDEAPVMTATRPVLRSVLMLLSPPLTLEHGVGGSGLRVERERCRELPVGLDVRLEVGDLLLGGADGVGPREEAARRRLLAGDAEQRPRQLRGV